MNAPWGFLLTALVWLGFIVAAVAILVIAACAAAAIGGALFGYLRSAWRRLRK